MTTPTQKGYISRQEAAAMMGVHPQSISNYLEKGLFKGKKHGNIVIIKRDSFEAFLNDTAKPIVEREEGLRKAIEELDEAKKGVIEARDRALLEKEILKTHGTYLRVAASGQFTRVINDIIVAFGILNRREAQLLFDIARGHIREEEAELLGLPRERVRQIFEKACVKLVQRAKELAECEAENRRLLERAEMQHDTIKKQQDLIRGYERELDIRRSRPIEVTKQEHDLRSQRALSWFDEQGASIRLLKGIKLLECETMLDLVTKSRNEILRCRNVGKKSLRELEEILEVNGLCLNMKFI